jgi:hypothetical protein
MASNFSLRQFENAHVFLWLIKDLCWCMLSETLGLIMVAPTLILALTITWKQWHERSEKLHNLAVVSWICANSTWMIGEFFLNDGLRNYALIFFLAGISILSYYYLSLFFTKEKTV